MRLNFSVVYLLTAGNVVFAATTPQITAVTSAAFFNAPAPGGLATIFGSGLSDNTYRATSLPLPQQLGPASVMVCPVGYGKPFPCSPASLLFVSPTQINFYVPLIPSTSGDAFDFGNNYPATYNVTVGSQSAKFISTLSAESPSIFPLGYDCDYDPNAKDASPCGLSATARSQQQVQRGAIIDLAGNIVTSQNPARPGRYYSMYLTGLYLASGQPAALAQSTSVEFSAIPTPQDPVFGSASGSVAPSYAGPSGFAGVQQINFLLDPALFGDATTGTLFACNTFQFEIPVSFRVGPGSADQHSHSLPVLVKNGDIPCSP